MCHHVCPIGNATGLERNTARARALGLSMVAREAIEYTDDVIKNVYECCLCGGCMTDCVTGWDPVMFTKEARLGAALDGKLPEYVMTMLGNIAESGNIYGEKEIADVLKNAIADLPAKADVLFFIGKALGKGMFIIGKYQPCRFLTGKSATAFFYVAVPLEIAWMVTANLTKMLFTAVYYNIAEVLFI